MMGAATARLGGLLLAISGSGVSATAMLKRLDLTNMVDRMVVASSSRPLSSSVPWLAIWIFVALGAIGIVLLGLTLARRHERVGVAA